MTWKRNGAMEQKAVRRFEEERKVVYFRCQLDGQRVSDQSRIQSFPTCVPVRQALISLDCASASFLPLPVGFPPS